MQKKRIYAHDHVHSFIRFLVLLHIKIKQKGDYVMKNFNQRNYVQEIMEMLKKIENPLILKLIYGFVKSGYEEEKAGRN